MRASNPKAVPARKTTLKVIQGALALYRQGDVITFDLNGVEFEASIESVQIEDGSALLWVTCALGVHAGHVKRVERRAVR